MLELGSFGEGWILSNRSQVHQDGTYIIPSNLRSRGGLIVSSRQENSSKSEKFQTHSIGVRGKELMRHHVVYFLVWNSDKFILIGVIAMALLA